MQYKNLFTTLSQAQKLKSIFCIENDATSNDAAFGKVYSTHMDRSRYNRPDWFLKFSENLESDIREKNDCPVIMWVAMTNTYLEIKVSKPNFKPNKVHPVRIFLVPEKTLTIRVGSWKIFREKLSNMRLHPITLRNISRVADNMPESFFERNGEYYPVT
jgi:hypothetical protein